MNNQHKLEEIEELLKPLSGKDQVEIIANIFIRLGTNMILADQEDEHNTLSQKETITLILNDIQEKGETLANSLARQGLIILSWLKK